MRAAVAVLLFLAASATDACTTFCTRGLFGRNYDFEIGYGMVVVNKRGMQKSSRVEHGARWTSSYGSVTFNQFGRDNPTGGMNEKGVVVELMWLDGTRYPSRDARPEIGTLEWIQYQLDTAAGVDDVIANAKKVRIIERGAPLHYLVADANGDVAAIEFLNGELIVHRGDRLPVAALANDPYTRSLTSMKNGAADRFARAAKALPAATTIDAAFAILDNVAQPSTQWSIVYDIRNRAIAWRTAANGARREVRFDAFDFRCASPVRVLDVDAGRGNVTAMFRDYTRTANETLVRKSTLETSFLSDTPEADIVEAARWPERATCSAGLRPAGSQASGLR
jgi:choloylglycine hydrolase